MLGLDALTTWPARRWVFAAAMAVLSGLAIGLPTDVIPNPIFGRQGTPVEPWAVPVLIATAALSGLLMATYLDLERSTTDDAVDRPTKLASVGGFLSFFAVGCPICNKLVVIALGTSGALSWFAPVQPYMGVAALVLLAWALRTRLQGTISCPVPVD